MSRCSLIGLTPSQAKDALTINPQRAILRGRASLPSRSFRNSLTLLFRAVAMRQTYRGVLSNPTLITSTSGESSALAKDGEEAVVGEKRVAPERADDEEGTQKGKRRKEGIS